jgi:hypothetical protein
VALPWRSFLRLLMSPVVVLVGLEQGDSKIAVGIVHRF